MRDEMELHMSALQAKQEGESMLKQQIMELSSKVDELQDDLYKQQAFGESLQVERDELRETLSQREADFEKMQVSAASLRQEESHEQEAELERMRESMAALSQVLVHCMCLPCPCSMCAHGPICFFSGRQFFSHESVVAQLFSERNGQS